jgi:hypothetical protein
LVRELVGHQPLGFVSLGHEVASEDRHALRFDGDLQLVLGDDRGVFGDRVGAEELRVHLQHPRMLAERGAQAAGQVRGRGDPIRDRRV